jgi:hypothetical protein
MKNYLTFLELESLCRREAGIGENDVDPVTRRIIINNKLMKIFALLDGLNDPFYDRFSILTVDDDVELLAGGEETHGSLTAINSTAKTISRSSGSFAAGSILDIVIVHADKDRLAGQWKARVITGGATCVYEKIGSGTEADADDSLLFTVHVMRSLSVLAVDLSNLYVKQVLQVYDDKGSGNSDRQFREIKDPLIFNQAHRDPLYGPEIVWHHGGDHLRFKVGADAAALGIVTCECRTKPAIYVAANENDVILLPPEYNQVLVDEVVATFMSQGGKAIPQGLADRQAAFDKVYAAAAASKASAAEVKGKRAS